MLTSIRHEVAQVALTHEMFADAWRERLASWRFDTCTLAAAGRRHFCGRGLLHALLEIAGESNTSLQLCVGASGRVTLPGSRWYVSISHTASYTAAAIARVPVGVDIEIRNRQLDWTSIVEAIFTAELAERIWAAPECRRREVFLEEWTRAEACAKLTDGLVVPLIDADMSGQHTFFATEELIGCVAIGSRERGSDA